MEGQQGASVSSGASARTNLPLTPPPMEGSSENRAGHTGGNSSGTGEHRPRHGRLPPGAAVAAPSGGQTKLLTEPYFQQRKLWPNSGKHILAQYDKNSVVVYQAFKPSIANYAVQNQRFGGPDFNFNRMTWIKTNFLWMMYRCGWATKPNQERVLAIRITRQGFNHILSNAYTFQRSEGVTKELVHVRLQWDPDHLPTYETCERRAIQMGLKGQIVHEYCQSILEIEDVTPFVHAQYKHVQAKDLQKLVTPRERVYVPGVGDIAARIELDSAELVDYCHE